MRVFMPMAFGALLLCCAIAPARTQAALSVREASTRFSQALAAGDAATAASFFADDGVVLPPGRAVAGKSQVQQFLGNAARNREDLKYVPEDVKQINDTTAREIGTFSFKPAKQGAPAVAAKYLLVWIRIGADWKITAEMWNRGGGGAAEVPAGGGE